MENQISIPKEEIQKRADQLRLLFCPYSSEELEKIAETLYTLDAKYGINYTEEDLVQDIFIYMMDTRTPIKDIDIVYFLYNHILYNANIGNHWLNDDIEIEGERTNVKYKLNMNDDVFLYYMKQYKNNVNKEQQSPRMREREQYARFILDILGLSMD